MFERRLKIFLGILAVVSLLLVARAGQVQVVDSATGGRRRRNRSTGRSWSRRSAATSTTCRTGSSPPTSPAPTPASITAP